MQHVATVRVRFSSGQSDDLHDLSRLREAVLQSDVLVLLQSAHVLERPWCLIELVTALDNRIPIVPVTLTTGQHSYDFAASSRFLQSLGTELEKRNPGAAKLLLDNGVDVVDCAHKLSAVIPNIISVDFNPSGSRNNIMACLLDVVESMRKAVPVEVATTREAFLAKRGSPPG